MKILKHFFAFIKHIKLDFVRVAQKLIFEKIISCVDAPVVEFHISEVWR